MNFTDLLSAIEAKTARVVVIGLGYVGLPVAASFAHAGFMVRGLDLDKDKVSKINIGISPIEGQEPGLGELVAQVVNEGRLHATVDYAVCESAEVILIAVETPVDSVHQPRYRALRAALRTLTHHMPSGALIIVESTIAPGTMARLVRPILEGHGQRVSGRDFYLVHCPERVMPGRLLRNLATMSRVIGGDTPEAARLAQAFYRHVVQADLDLADCVTAELVKTAENAYRDVQIAFANELALICEQVGADVWQVRELVNKSPGRNVLLPGAGVGGHCIPKDPWLLAYGARDAIKARLIPAAREINDGMPLHMAELTVDALAAVGIEIEEARVAVLGYSYLENSDDVRNSPSIPLIGRLEELGAEVVVHDPFVPLYRRDLRECVQGCDAIVVMVKHDAYFKLDLFQLKAWSGGKALIDGRHVFDRSQAEAAGWVYRGVGMAR